ncbi:MAG: radical SAM protein [Spirochaetes bacterium]|nr:radical SAM protein [Spirochaetota bacterium]
MKKKSIERFPSMVERRKRRIKSSERIFPAYCKPDGMVIEEPRFRPAFRTGKIIVPVDPSELIPLPFGSVLFSLPHRFPVYFDNKGRKIIVKKIQPRSSPIYAVSAFLSSGYLRTYLPAYVKSKIAKPLSLWAYTAVVVKNGNFYVPALRIDSDPRSDPQIHQNDAKLQQRISEMQHFIRNNRLAAQLAHCAMEYRCLCARNFFLSRYEVPVPTSPFCNAECIGCLSRQEGSGFCASQERISFLPTPEEIAEVILYHFERVDSAVASFGQGCEGEPLLRGKDIARAIGLVRRKTSRGTINLNTNGSKPHEVKRLIDAGLDSIRISLNSPTRKYYDVYFQPKGYSFDDVLRSIDIALTKNIFVSINLFFLPGFTDMESEVESLFDFLQRFPVSMIQTRNLNIDPDLYLESVNCVQTKPIGIRALIKLLYEKFPHLKIGYYNPPKEKFDRN